MTGKVVNLNRWKKARARDEKRAEAEENAARHGRNKTEKAKDAAAKARDEKHLDDHKREE